MFCFDSGAAWSKQKRSKLVTKFGNCSQKFLFFLFFGGFFFFLFVQYSALLRLPPLRFHCADGCLDGTQDRCNLCIGSQTL
jgi:hypothetical protein